MRAHRPYCLLKLLIAAETLVKAVNTSAGIYQLLLAGKERMTFRADFHSDILFGRAGLDDLATCATNGRRFVMRMNSLFHYCHLFQKTCYKCVYYNNILFVQLQAFLDINIENFKTPI